MTIPTPPVGAPEWAVQLYYAVIVVGLAVLFLVPLGVAAYRKLNLNQVRIRATNHEIANQTTSHTLALAQLTKSAARIEQSINSPTTEKEPHNGKVDSSIQGGG